MPDLLIELLSEEIPARMQARAREDLRRMVTDGLVEAGLTYAGAAAFSTPRRLVLAVQGLTAESPTLREERKGPRTDAPEAALEGFLRSTGLSRDRLEARDAGKGQVWFAVVEKPGRKAAEIVAGVLEATVRGFPWPKSMRWGAGGLRWVRPLHSILCLLTDEGGSEVVPVEIDGLRAGNRTRGHRFMAGEEFSVTSFEDYAAKLKRAKVMLDPAEREAHIHADAANAAFAAGLELVEDQGLLAEVAGLVEWPVVLMGAIGEEFLDLPPEVLRTSMKEHQKFFSVRNPKTGHIERFVTVANRETADGGATILQGNQKVLSARLSDAKFFWENDLRTVAQKGLEGMAEGLASVTFHNKLGKLGSQADRVARIEALARKIAPLVGASPDLAAEAARVVKADLQSAMVGEFPELQGVMGGYYARAAGLPEAVAAASRAHYSPLGPADEVPSEPVSVAVALADKIDLLAVFWAIKERPTGSRDPFALRRAALGVLRTVLTCQTKIALLPILVEQIGIHLDANAAYGSVKALQENKAFAAVALELLNMIQGYWSERSSRDWFTALVEEYEDKDALGLVEYPDRTWSVFEATFDLLSFLHDRLKVHLRDQGVRHDVIDACLVLPGNDDLTLLVRRAEALAAFLKTDDGENLLQGFKRANNILAQAEEKDGVEYSFGADPKFAEGPEEKALFAALDAAEAAIGPAMEREDFAAAMAAMAALRTPIDAFFTAVQVNSDNPVIRRNRLNLLSRIRRTCLAVADLTRIEG